MSSANAREGSRAGEPHCASSAPMLLPALVFPAAAAEDATGEAFFEGELRHILHDCFRGRKKETLGKADWEELLSDQLARGDKDGNVAPRSSFEPATARVVRAPRPTGPA